MTIKIGLIDSGSAFRAARSARFYVCKASRERPQFVARFAGPGHILAHGKFIYLALGLLFAASAAAQDNHLSVVHNMQQFNGFRLMSDLPRPTEKLVRRVLAAHNIHLISYGTERGPELDSVMDEAGKMYLPTLDIRVFPYSEQSTKQLIDVRLWSYVFPRKRALLLEATIWEKRQVVAKSAVKRSLSRTLAQFAADWHRAHLNLPKLTDHGRKSYPWIDPDSPTVSP